MITCKVNDSIISNVNPLQLKITFNLNLSQNSTLKDGEGNPLTVLEVLLSDSIFQEDKINEIARIAVKRYNGKIISNDTFQSLLTALLNILNLRKIKIDSNVLESELRQLYQDNSNPEQKTEVGETKRNDEAVDGTISENMYKLFQNQMDNLFGKVPAIKTSLPITFKSRIVENLFINLTGEKGFFARTDAISFNKNLAKYQMELFKDIVNYLNKHGYNIPNDELYTGQDFILNGNYVLVLEQAFDFIQSQINQKTSNNSNRHSDLLSSGWGSEQSLKYGSLAEASEGYDVNAVEYYKFVEAWFSLRYFDDLLNNVFGKIISVTTKSSQNVLPASIKLGDKPKYSLGIDKSGRNTGFTDDNKRNGFTEAGRFSVALLTSLPLYSYSKYSDNLNSPNAIQNSKQQGRLMDQILVNRAFNTLLKLVRNGEISSEDTKETRNARIINGVNSIINNPKYYIKDILDALFERTVDTKQTVMDVLLGRNQISIKEADTLFSLWKNVYSTSIETGPSIIKLENEHIKNRVINPGDNFVYSDCISGLINRVVEIQYLAINYDKGEIGFRKKFSWDNFSFKLRDKINNSILNGGENSSRNLLLSKYKFYDDKNTITIKLSGFDIIVNPNIDKKLNYNIFTTDSSTVSIKIGDEIIPVDQFFKDINFSSKASLNKIHDVNTEIGKVLQFLSDTLLENFLSDDYLQILHLYKLEHKNSMFSELLEAAARILYTARILENFDNSGQNSLPLFLLKHNSDIFKSIGKEISGRFNPDTQNALFKNRFSLLGDFYFLNPVSLKKDKWVDHLSEARLAFLGDVSKSTSTNYSGNKEQNGRTAHLGALIHTYIQDISVQQKRQNAILNNKAIGKIRRITSANLLMAKNANILRGSILSSDVKAIDGSVKAIKAMNTSELLFTNIFHNFFGMYYQDGELLKKIALQPTTYSDKSSIISFLFSADSEFTVGNKKYGNLMSITSNDLSLILIDTIGKYYQDAAANIINDYSKIFGESINVLQLTEDEIKQRLLDINAKLIEFSKGFNKVDDAELALIKLAQKAKVELLKETHYSIFGGKLGINPLLNHYLSLYSSKNNVSKFLKNELRNFVNSIIDSGLYIDIDDEFVKLAITKKFGSVSEALKKGWIKNGYLVLAKVGEEQIVQGTEITASNFEVNPLLEQFFNVSNAVNSNMRVLLTGSEIAHPLKKSKFYKGGTKKLNEIFSKYGISPVNNLVELQPLIEGNNKAKAAYEEIIRELQGIAGAEGAQLKRNVIIPATMLLIQQKGLNTISTNIKVAVMKDISAAVNTFNGKAEKEDAHDGSALINPFFSILENNGLQDLATYLDKKPIWHSYNHLTGTATLVKYASFTITNLRMMQSLKSDVSLYNLFKKMTNVKWKLEGDDWNSNTWSNETGSKIDLVNGRKFGLNKEGQLETKIKLKDATGNSKGIIYGQGSEYWRINEFDYQKFEGLAQPIYYTEERRLNIDGSDSSEKIKVYHLFDENSNHIQLSEEEVKSKINDIKTGKLHTINSLFEFHSALGGIFCVEQVNGEFVSSEANNKAIAYYMSFVGDSHLTHIVDKNISGTNNAIVNNLTLDQYPQPLKQLMISVAANTSAVKNGQANINPDSAWSDNNDLTYMTLSSKMYGIQQDSDHEADEATLTEPTQVMTALSQGGSLHKYAKQIYQSVGKVSLLASQVELKAFLDFIDKRAKGDPKAINTLYDIVGRIVLNNADTSREELDLCSEILNEIRKEFGEHSDDHTLAKELKIAFSDPNLYGKVFPAIISTINSKGIRRKNPGNGMVMSPGYGIYQTFKLGDKRVGYNELIRRIQIPRTEINEGTFTGKTLSPEAIKAAVDLLLLEELAKQPIFNYNAFDLGDRINIIGSNSISDKLRSSTVIWGHPGSGKTYLHELGRNDIIDFDSEYKVRINKLMGLPEGAKAKELRKAARKERSQEYHDLIMQLFDEAVAEARATGKKLLVSDLMLLKEREADIDAITNMSDEKFIERSAMRGETDVADKMLWKNDINDAINNVSDKSKIILTENFLSLDLIQPVSIYINSIDRFYAVDNKEWIKLSNNLDLLEKYKITHELLLEFGLYQLIANLRRDPNNDLNELLTLMMDPILKLYNYSEFKYQEDVTKGIDLLPTRILFTENGIKRSIYHIPMIKNAFKSGEEINTFIMKALFTDLKQKGGYYDSYNWFEIKDKRGNIINKEIRGIGEFHQISDLKYQKPLAIVSNMWATRFNTKGHYTLNEVESGNLFDIEKFLSNLKPINESKTHLTFLKGNGQHTCITFEPISKSDNTKNSRYEKVSLKNFRLERVEKNGKYCYNVIALNSDNSDSMIVGLKIEIPKLKVVNNRIVNSEGIEISKEDISKNSYKIIEIDGVKKVFKEFNYLNEYNLQHRSMSKAFSPYTTYSIDEKQIQELCNLTGENYVDVISNIVTLLYSADSYIGFTQNIKNSELLGNVSGNKYTGILGALAKNNLELIPYCRAISKNDKVEENLQTLVTNYSNELKTSFLKSKEIVGSRIPAQTLQSFMSMEIVDYTQMETNVAYVSHIQTFLQGSDYDIDKCYMISYFFDDNGRFIKWSPLMSLNNLEELNASTKLPVPMDTRILKVSDDKFRTTQKRIRKNKETLNAEFKAKHIVDITEDLIRILVAEDSKNKVAELEAYADLIDSLDSGSGEGYLEGEDIASSIVFYDYDTNRLSSLSNDVEKRIKSILDNVNKHEKYKAPDHLKEKALLNANTAKINLIISDLENVNSANTPINMDDAQKATERRLGRTLTMNLWNPAVIYEMQVENQTGKNVIGIAANGEKGFFTLYYYFSEGYRKLLELQRKGQDDPELRKFLEFRKTFSRIQGRWKADDPEIADGALRNRFIQLVTKTKIANLNFNLTGQSNDIDFEVDQMISQLLSAATDNAKELILAKINANADLAKIFFYGLILGFDINDLTAFMTTPMVDLITELSHGNIFDPSSKKNIIQVYNMITEGNYPLSKYLDSNKIRNVNRLLRLINGKYKSIQEFLKAKNDGTETLSFKEFMLSFDKTPIDESNTLYYSNEDKQDIDRLSEYVDCTAKKVLAVKNKYIQMYGDTTSFDADLKEFKNLWNMANEVTSLTNNYLSTNLGLPTTFDKYISRTINIEKSVKDREAELVAYDSSGKVVAKFTTTGDNKVDNLVTLMLAANPQYSGQEDYLRAVAEQAFKLGIAGDFNYSKYLTDSEYQKVAIQYYDTIKGTFNIFHFIQEHPQYSANMTLFGVSSVMTNDTNLKTKLLFRSIKALMGDSTYWDSSLNRKVTSAVEEIIIRNFLQDIDINLELDPSWFTLSTEWRLDKSTPRPLEFKSGFDYSNFKYVMENYILPGLQSGQVQVSKGNKKVSIEDNKFISGLHQEVSFNRPSLVLDLDLSAREVSPLTNIKYQEYTQGFKELSSYIMPGFAISGKPASVQDLFVLYNLIVNLNRFGSDKYTSIYKGSISKDDKSSLLYKYYELIGNLDQTSYLLDDSYIDDMVTDILIKLAPIVSSKKYISLLRSKYVKVREHGLIKLYKDGKEAAAYVIDSEGRQGVPDTEQNINIMKYACLFSQKDSVEAHLSKLETTDYDLLFEVIRDLITTNKLIVSYIC